MSPIAIVLGPRFKLGHIPHGEHKFVMKTLLNMLKSVHLIEASSSTLIDDLLASSSHKCSKVLMQFYGAVIKYEHNTRRETNKGQLEDYLHETFIDCLCDDSLQLEDCF